MNYAVETGTALNALSGWNIQHRDWNQKSSEDIWQNWNRALLQYLGETASVRIKEYAPNLLFPNSWLPVVESRIRASIMPSDHDSEPSGKWLTENAARAAIAFLQAGADVLPAEPHIYGTQDGDFVAEFESPAGHMTSVVSKDETTLFAVRTDEPDKPLQYVIHRGSNHYRDELRSFTKKLTAGSHGKMVAVE